MFCVETCLEQCAEEEEELVSRLLHAMNRWERALESAKTYTRI